MFLTKRKFVYFILAVLFLVVAGKALLIYVTQEKSVVPPYITMEAEGCDNSIDPYGPETWPELEKLWTGTNTLQVTSYMSTFCGGAEVVNPSFIIKNKTISIQYEVEIDEAVTLCNCMRKLKFTIYNLEYGIYDVEVSEKTT